MTLRLETKSFITLSGYPGAGKSTVAKILANCLNWEHYGMGKIQRLEADRRGLSLMDFNSLAGQDQSIDRELDKRQSEIAIGGNCLIFDGRLSWHFIPDSLKVYLSVEPQEAARRMLQEVERRTEEFKSSVSLEEIVAANELRMEGDRRRYLDIYGVDLLDMANYDLVIDATSLAPQEVAYQIMKAARARQMID